MGMKRTLFLPRSPLIGIDISHTYLKMHGDGHGKVARQLLWLNQCRPAEAAYQPNRITRLSHILAA